MRSSTPGHFSGKVELLAPAGNFEKLEIAIHFGADAVYLAGKQYSLRNFSDNFSLDELTRGIQFAHDHHVKVYVACNSFASNSDMPGLKDYLLTLNQVRPDAIIIADPGVLNLAKEYVKNIPLHLSTQANTTNLQSALFWKNLGIRRINLARELALPEIKEIAEQSGMEIEIFIHGAMCIAYSGRCLLSHYLTNRGANQGMCTHACRWRYSVLEETRPGVFIPIAEDDQGTYLFSSKDLCMMDHIPEIIHSGVCSLKIEGRMKSVHYLATAVKVYREAIDTYLRDPESYAVKSHWKRELSLINHRGYCTGFYFGDPKETSRSAPPPEANVKDLFLGKILAMEKDTFHLVDVRNKLGIDDVVEILSPEGLPVQDRILEIMDPEGEIKKSAHPGTRVGIRFEKRFRPNDIIRKQGIYS